MDRVNFEPTDNRKLIYQVEWGLILYELELCQSDSIRLRSPTKHLKRLSYSDNMIGKFCIKL